MSLLLLVLALAPFYLLGSFPSGYLVGRLRGITIWDHGSGNVGATNVARVIGRSAGLFTLITDVVKGALAVIIGGSLTSYAHPVAAGCSFPALCGIAVVLGHCFSIPGRLKGGKGVATGLGACFILSPFAALVSVAIFAILAGVTRVVALASIGATLSTPILAMLLIPLTHGGAPHGDALALGVIALVITLRHRTNIQRLIEGREPKLGSRELS